MVQSVTFRLSALNNLPGASGIDDVSFDVPQLDDIRDEIDGTLPDIEEIRTAVREEVEAVLTDEAIDLEGELPEIDVPGAEAVAEAVLDALGAQKGLFGPLDEPLDSVLETAVRDGLAEIEDVSLPLDPVEDLLDDLQDDVADVQDDVTDALDDVRDDISADVQALRDDLEAVQDLRVQEELQAALTDLPGATLLTDPDTFIDDQIARVTDDLVDEEARDRLQAAVDGGE